MRADLDGNSPAVGGAKRHRPLGRLTGADHLRREFLPRKGGERRLDDLGDFLPAQVAEVLERGGVHPANGGRAVEDVCRHGELLDRGSEIRSETAKLRNVRVNSHL